MNEIISGAGVFLWPLLACSVIAVFIICERLYASRRRAVLPPDLVGAILENKPFSGGRGSVLGRILEFSEIHQHDEEAVKAFARLEINRMERGFVFLDIIISIAPLLGLLGTVTGLWQVFHTLGAGGGSGIPDPSQFTKGIALALSTTVIGLAIAIPSVVGSGYLQRRVETYAAEIDSLLERIQARANLT